MRHLSERGPALNGVVTARFVPPGGKVLDIFAGTLSLAIPLIMKDPKATYLGIDNDDELVDPATMRLGRAHRMRDEITNAYDASLASVCAFQALATNQESFILPDNNIPTHLPDGAPLGFSAVANLPTADDKSPWPLEILDTGMSSAGLDMGQGLFLRKDAPAIVKGTYIAGISFFGNFLPTSQLATRFPDGCPGFPGVFVLSEPLQEYCLVMDARCPGAKLNDAHGTCLCFP